MCGVIGCAAHKSGGRGMDNRKAWGEAALMALGAVAAVLIAGWCIAGLLGTWHGDGLECAQFHGIREVYCWAER